MIDYVVAVKLYLLLPPRTWKLRPVWLEDYFVLSKPALNNGEYYDPHQA